MSEVFEFSVQRSVHDGGTKYYQVIGIRASSGHGIVVTHYGRHAPGFPHEPKNHGQCKIERLPSCVASTAISRRRAKEKRGYSAWSEKIDRSIAADELLTKVREWFSADDERIIMQYMTGTAVMDMSPVSEPKFIEPSLDKVKITAAPVIEAPKSAEWGTW